MNQQSVFKKKQINFNDIVSKINNPAKFRKNPLEKAQNSSTFLLENLTPLDYINKKNRQQCSIDLGRPQFVSNSNRSKQNYFKRQNSKENFHKSLNKSSQYNIISEKKNDFLLNNDNFQKKHITIKRDNSFSSQLDSMVKELNKSVQGRCGSSEKKTFKIPSSSKKILDTTNNLLRGSVDKTLRMIENYRNLPLKNRIRLNQQNQPTIEESKNMLTPIKPRFNILKKQNNKEVGTPDKDESKSILNLTNRYSGSLKRKIEGLILKRKNNGSNLKLKIDSIKKKGQQFIKKFDADQKTYTNQKSSKNSFILNKSNNSLLHRHMSLEKVQNDRSLSENIAKDTSMPFYQRPKTIIQCFQNCISDRN